MTQRAHRDQTLFCRPTHLPGVELIHASYKNRTFPLHAHPEYVVGILTGGRQILRVEDEDHLIETGDVLRLHPREAHANRCVGSEVLSYRVFYLPEQAVSVFLQDGARESRISFPSPKAADEVLACVLLNAHRALWSTAVGKLEQEAVMMKLVHAVASDDGEEPADAALPSAHDAVTRARNFIDEHFRADFGLEELAAACGLSVYRVAHLFRGDVGLSPIAYRNQRRIFESRAQLLQGRPIAEVALDMGYYDQSHFTRHFQRVLGVSPAKYVQQ